MPELVQREYAMPPALIFGCGYLGMRVAQAWLARSRTVYALTRNRADELKALGIQPIVGDVLDPHSLRSLPEVGTILYAIGLDRKAGRSMREVYVDGLRNALSTLGSTAKFLYVSSTSVYGQTDGGWVDESSPTEPLEDSGRIVLDAEQTLRRHRPDSVILRFAGIYGPGRILRKASLLKGEPVPGDAERYLNLIHVEDGVRAVLAAEVKANGGETYLIADDTPPTRREFFTRTAELIGAPIPTFLNDGIIEANRRIRNTKAKKQLGFTPQFPSYREGLVGSTQ